MKTMVSFYLQVQPLDDLRVLLDALHNIFENTNRIGPFTIRIIDVNGPPLIAEVAWRGAVFMKLQLPRVGHTGGICTMTWSEGGSPSGEWLPQLKTIGEARLSLKSALREHAERILGAQSQKLRDAAEAIAMLNAAEANRP